ncbi:MAG: hypothetical protein AAF429_04000 [Pseudomonadota bacterium]
MTKKPTKKVPLILTPMSRLTMTFNEELNLDQNKVFNKEYYDNLIARFLEVQASQNALVKNLGLINTILFLILHGQEWTIPILNVEIAQIPAIKEIFVFYSSLAFYFLCMVFVNAQSYSGLINQCGNRVVDSRLIDPDYYNAAKIEHSFPLKLYRPKSNIWGVDFFEPGKGFRILSFVNNLTIILAALIIPAIHFGLIGYALYLLWDITTPFILAIPYLAIIAILNIGGLLLVIGMSVSFTFYQEIKIEEPKELPKTKSVKRKS